MVGLTSRVFVPKKCQTFPNYQELQASLRGFFAEHHFGGFAETSRVSFVAQVVVRIGHAKRRDFGPQVAKLLVAG